MFSMSRNWITALRRIGIVEGISLLVLLFVAMPLKYFANRPEFVTVVGWIHGFLFILFMTVAYIVYEKLNWPFKKLVQAFIAAFFPFGTFIFDKQLKSSLETVNRKS